MICPICAGALPEPKATGRPAVYCSDPCRRQAEYQLRRVNAHLSEAERKLMRARVDLAAWGSHHAGVHAAWQAEVDRLRAELDVLLAVAA